MHYGYLFNGSGDNKSEKSSPEDQRSRPRTGPIEKIADITFDTMRKHKPEPKQDDESGTS